MPRILADEAPSFLGLPMDLGRCVCLLAVVAVITLVVLAVQKSG
jgi:hypothetical protein